MFELNLQRAILKDRYEIRGRISSGSYAEVFVARDRESGNAVVIKALNTRLQGIPPPELEQMLGEKFQSENAILNKIRHANIVSVLDQGDGEDATGRAFGFIVLEFMSELARYAVARYSAVLNGRALWLLTGSSPTCGAIYELGRASTSPLLFLPRTFSELVVILTIARVDGCYPEKIRNNSRDSDRNFVQTIPEEY